MKNTEIQKMLHMRTHQEDIFTVLSYNKKADMSPSWASIGNKQLRHFIAWCVLMSILMGRYDRERTVALTLVFTGKFCGINEFANMESRNNKNG